MDSNRTKVTVKRIEKIPSKYYVQAPTVKAVASTKVKIELSDSLWAERKRLTDALSLRPPLVKDYTKTLMAKLKTQLTQVTGKSKALVSGGLCYLIENAKRLAFSGAVSAGVVAAACAILISTCSIGYEISIDGQVIGTAKETGVYLNLIEDINREINYISREDFAPGAEPKFSLRLIAKGAYTHEADMKERLKATSSEMLPAYGVYVNDEIIFALANENTAIGILEDYKNGFVAGKAEATAEFADAVSVSRRFVPKSALRTKESATEALYVGRFDVCELKGGEKLTEVATNYGITIDDILKNNIVSDAENLSAGYLKIPTHKPLVTVATTERKTISETIPYQVIETEDPTKYEGRLIVEQEGVAGSRVIDAYITTINGVETGRTVISENLLSAPIDQLVKVGTKEPPSPIGTGEMAVPANGTLTSRYGSRWGRNHNGVDVGASIGTKIYAADNGTVTYSAYDNGGYGYMIKIDHGNGIETYYAHCNELLVPQGAVVAKGDLIATVGNTGRSTGPHLHFEVRVNGTPKNPANYLSSLQ